MSLNGGFVEGRLRLAADSTFRFLLQGAAPLLCARRGAREIRWMPVDLRREGAEWQAEHANEALHLTWSVRVEEQTAHFRVRLENRGLSSIRVDSIAPLALFGPNAMVLGAGTDRWSMLRNGYQSWSGTRAYSPFDRDRDPPFTFLRMTTNDLRHPSSGRRGEVRSDLFTAILNRRSGEALCLGFLDSRAAFGAIHVAIPAGEFEALVCECDFDGVELRPGDELHSEPLRLAVGWDAWALLEELMEEIGRTMRARVPARSPSGWCSWYYYFTRIDEEKILRNVETLRTQKEQFRCDYVQIDDGYQPAIGDWLETNSKFPHGMAWIAERIRGAGFDAGIWLAPFIARRDSRLFREHPDWFVRRPDGRLRSAIWNPAWGWLGVAYALDTTHPAVLDWLEKIGRTFVGEWGYRILKLDFLFAAALPGVRYDQHATRAQALRRGLEAIRRGTGDDAFLLGCGCPLGPAIGVVDAMRIGADVAPFWSLAVTRTVMRDLHGVATKHAIRNILTRSFMHRRLWLNDPDCLMVRSDKTRLSLAEVRSLAAAVALTDGMFVVSDRMDTLTRERLEILRRAQAWIGGRPRVVDLFDRSMPELLVSEAENAVFVAAFNFDDSARVVRLDAARLNVSGTAEELWSGRAVDVRDGWLDAGKIAPHGCALFRFIRDA